MMHAAGQKAVSPSLPSPVSFTGEGQGEGKSFARRLRSQSTWAERRLWFLLRNRRFADYKFRRQHPEGPYILDFYCVSARLAVELDGDVHGHPGRQQHDAEKDRYLAEQGIRALRFWNFELKENEEGVLAVIFAELEQRKSTNPHPDPLPSRRERGSLLPI